MKIKRTHKIHLRGLSSGDFSPGTTAGPGNCPPPGRSSFFPFFPFFRFSVFFFPPVHPPFFSNKFQVDRPCRARFDGRRMLFCAPLCFSRRRRRSSRIAQLAVNPAAAAEHTGRAGETLCAGWLAGWLASEHESRVTIVPYLEIAVS